MIYVIGAKNGSFRQPIEAETFDEALQLLAEHFEYKDYPAMLEGLKYRGTDLEVNALIDERNKRPEYVEWDQGSYIKKLTTRAFKRLRQ